jgi:hypothetical protein
MAQSFQGTVHVWLVMLKAMRALTKYAAAGIEETGLGLSDFAVLESCCIRGLCTDSLPSDVYVPLEPCVLAGDLNFDVSRECVVREIENLGFGNVLGTRVPHTTAGHWIFGAPLRNRLGFRVGPGRGCIRTRTFGGRRVRSLSNFDHCPAFSERSLTRCVRDLRPSAGGPTGVLRVCERRRALPFGNMVRPVLGLARRNRRLRSVLIGCREPRTACLERRSSS